MSEKNELEVFDKSTLKKTEKRVKEMQESGEIDFPPDYSPANALKSAWLELQGVKDKNGELAINSCTKASVMEAMLETVIQGLNPAKEQIYYIPYGKNLVAQRSYFGDIAVLKRVENVKEVRPNIIYEGDSIDLETKDGRTVVGSHKTSWENRQNDVAGAYAVVVFGDDRPDWHELMNMDEIKASWDQSKMNNSPTQNDFPQEMAKRTVVRRACKRFINSSDDAHLLSGKQITAEQSHESQVEAEKEEQANQEVIDVEQDNEPEEPEPQSDTSDNEGGNNGELPLDDGKSDLERQPDF